MITGREIPAEIPSDYGQNTPSLTASPKGHTILTNTFWGVPVSRVYGLSPFLAYHMLTSLIIPKTGAKTP